MFAFHALVQHAHIGLDSILIPEPDMQRIPIEPVKLGVRAALLHHEDIDAEF